MISKGLTIIAVLLIGVMGVFIVGCSSDNPLSTPTSASISGGELDNPTSGTGGTPDQRFEFEYTGRIGTIDKGNRSFVFEDRQVLSIQVDDNTKIYALPDYDEIDFDSKSVPFESSINQVSFKVGATVTVYGGQKGDKTVIAQYIEVEPSFSNQLLGAEL
jgi:hypothetical protein